MKLVPALLAFVALVLPQIAAAQVGQIIPEGCYCDTESIGYESAPALGCVLQTVQNLMNVGIALGVIIASLVIAYAGLLWVLNPFHAENKKLGRTMITNAVIGLVIAVGAWIFIDFLMKTVYNEGTFGPWNEILGDGPKCFAPASTGQQPTTPTQPGGPTTPTEPGDPTTPTQPGTSTSGTYTHSQAVAQLGSGVSVVSSGSCTDKSNPTCTSLDGIQQDVINQIVAIKQACTSCSLIITGGTETGHEPGTHSHGSGWKIDLDNTGSLNAFFEQNLTLVGSRNNGDPRYVDDCGNEYVYERTVNNGVTNYHWDITVNHGVCSL